MGEHRISALVLNYGAPGEMLASCVDSLLGSRGVDLFEILVLENGSRENRGAAAEVAEARGPRVRLVDLGANHGYAGGINRGIGSVHSTCDLLFLLNNDARVEPEALATCVAALDDTDDPLCIAVAPKMLLASDATILDSVGNMVKPNGEAANIGLGQPDLGQYDSPGEARSSPGETRRGQTLPRDCFGACFGAALLRRDAFEPRHVGPLDERLFLYYEDVDWSWRAQLLGYRTVAAPNARVIHVMSASTRDLPYGYKFYYTERNLLLCAMKNAEGIRPYGIWLRRMPRYLRGALNGHYPKASLQTFAGAIRLFPHAWLARRTLQRRRVRRDTDIFRYSEQEQTFFDAVRYVPIRSWAALAAAADRSGHRAVADAARSCDASAVRQAAVAHGQPVREAVMRYVAQLVTVGGAATVEP